MKKLTFKAGSQPHIIYKILNSGGSLTHEEAIPHGISRLAQRIADMKNKFEDADIESPIMVMPFVSNRTNVARYFFKGSGCSLESNSKARMY